MTRSRFETWGAWLAAVILVGYFVWAGVLPKLRSHGADGAVITLEVAFDDPASGSRIDERLAGSLSVSNVLQNVAMCRNGPDWLSDVTLDDNVVVSTLPELVRAAELGTSGRFEWDLISEIEQLIWNGVNPPDIPDYLEERGRDRNQVADYIVERSMYPSHDALDRFVAYAAARNLLGEGIVRVVDVTLLDHGAIRSFADRAGDPHIYLAGSGGEPRKLAPSACDQVLEDLRQ